ncbi:unnamed protein product [Rotaria magnacalcarata]|uniref:Transposase domain-containing protein n=1 Tax=Rotaria magnacalcarata TaxID=392030 RepID=A0A816XJD2_9BILA|nr:unnamed protein product [Rotaria magnacalcarata]CAF2147780.1 unnamed protein product [Rotaria magnacalcarata]CAF3951720.1 unnamed protein product [Rotaria magnacalcarata]CAF4184295.1 unnamed protein product [Rotaria magnacalcarata]
MSNANLHRSTNWRRKQAKLLINDLVVEFTRVTNQQENDTISCTTNAITDFDLYCDSDTNSSASFNRDMESPVALNSEKTKKDDERNDPPSIFPPIVLDDEQSEATIDLIHVATALIALKSRHNLSQRCIDDILSLLVILGINIPSSYKALCTLLRKRSQTHLSPSTHTICPHCENLSQEVCRCTTCGANYLPILPSKIPLFYTYNISKQLKAILSTSPDLVLHNKNAVRKTTMKDITDGNVYINLIEKDMGSIITLTMNVDGIQPNKGSDRSIWPVLLVINEIKRKKRYSPENTIIAGMWPGPSKPSRNEMSLFFKNIVSDLQDLEKGHVFQLYCPEHDYRCELLKVFLISACCDKPAQCLIQCLPEPTAFFGCGNCEIEGISVPTNNHGSIVSFAIYENDQLAYERTNERHDLLLEQQRKNKIQMANFTRYRGRRALIEAHKNTEKGIKGPCMLRILSYFDVGHSFLVDSLHNIYLGLFRRLLSLWLSHQDKDEQWSVYSRINYLSSLLSRIRFPSTTTRYPRSLNKFAKYKGSELRLVLLFGHSIFEKILKDEYYSHFLLLVLAIHYAESRCLTRDMVDIVGKLCNTFLYEFPKLYTTRQNVQVVHSISHLSETLRKFGPLSTYSTFNFENRLGVLTRSSKGTRRHATEMMNNLMYLRDACFESMKPDMNKVLHKLISPWLHMTNSYSNATKYSVRTLHPLNTSDQAISSIFPGEIVYYSTAFIDQVRFTTYDYARNKVADDSSIIFTTGSEENFGRIRCIFSINDAEPMFYVDVVSNMTAFTCRTTTDVYSYSNIQTGLSSDNTNSILISAKDIIEKCVFYERSDKICTFYRFPNLEECS